MPFFLQLNWKTLPANDIMYKIFYLSGLPSLDFWWVSGGCLDSSEHWFPKPDPSTDALPWEVFIRSGQIKIK